MKSDIFRTLVYSEPWHILKPWYIQNLWNILDEVFYSEPLSIAYLDYWYIQNFSILRLKTFKILRIFKIQFTQTICNLGIFTALVYSSPGRLRAQGILRNLSNMYEGLFSSAPCVTLVFSELKVYSEPCQIFMMENFIHNLVWP